MMRKAIRPSHWRLRLWFGSMMPRGITSGGGSAGARSPAGMAGAGGGPGEEAPFPELRRLEVEVRRHDEAIRRTAAPGLRRLPDL